ncbi:MAG: TolC family protein, partial [Rubrivivax sp.]|nr:TolC family protein [Rubrivivax sp.]
MDLRTAFGAAEERDAKLAAARANRDVAAESAPIAQARLLPQVALRGTVSRINQTETTETLLGPRSDQFTGPSDNVQLSLRQTIYRPRDQIGVTIGELQAAIGEYRLSSAWSDVWLRTVRLWLEVLAADAQREALVEALEAAQRVQVQERKRLEAGDGTRDAVAEAEAQVIAAQARLRDAELLLASRRRAFTLQTGLEGPDLARWQLPGGPPPPVLAARDHVEFADLVVARNAELSAAEATRMIEDARLAQARADYRPTVDLFAAATYQRNDTASNVGATYRSGQVGVQFSVPLYTGGGLTAAERQAAAA